ncbi:uncharacterized protein LOC123545746 [Mercenaria mercenaria]|uniref:uncharacterized protein LOC123545746 n=1 Tax=Mercenaria mercenaria TaxID=6596 RepID=UPI00234EB09F|nr:uncharacterized protein LOC123545746 [Mercenaria mercenaria]
MTTFIFKYLFGKIKFGESLLSLAKLRENSSLHGDSSGWSSQVSLKTSRKALSEVTTTEQDDLELPVPKTALSTVLDEEQSEVFIDAPKDLPNEVPFIVSVDLPNETPVMAPKDLQNEIPVMTPKDLPNEIPVVASEGVAVATQSAALGATSGEDHNEKLDEISDDVTTSEPNDIQAIFKLIDPDGDGYITLDKLRLTSQKLGLSFTEDEMKDMIQQADSSGTGQVNYKEMNTLFVETKVAMDAEQKLISDIDEAFDFFDTGQDGRLRTAKLASALRIANMYPTDKDVRKILRKLGYPIKITYKQFRKIALQVSKTDNERLVAAFQCFDKDNSGYLSEEKLRQILRPALCNDFTKKDLEELISDFSADGKIDLEVFVAYLTGQEQYLSTAKRPNIHKTALQLPSISEEFSVSSGPTKLKLKKKLK